MPRVALAGGTPQLFVVHLMKTGGTTLLVHILANVERERVWGIAPRGTDLFDRIALYCGIEPLRALSPAEADRYQVFSGHVPFVAVDVVARPGMVVATVLRDPVTRTISYLRQCARDHPEHRGRPLEAIYEDPYFHPRTIRNHQTKMLGMSLEQALTPTPPSPWASDDMAEALVQSGYFETAQFVADHLDLPMHRAVPVDEGTLAAARANIERADVLGLREDYDSFLVRLGERMGWSIEPGVRANVGLRAEVPDSFRRRIEDDNTLDRELYEHARSLLGAP
jgi:hypothetical protein